jgi:hypothetical protein
MAGFEKSGWYLAIGNVAVFAIVCAITLLSGHPSTVALMG